jgi:peptidyl-prolyl cis-trans isomerase C
MIRKTASAWLGAVLLAGAMGAYAAEKAADKPAEKAGTAATVNGTAISEDRLERAFQAFLQSQGQAAVAAVSNPDKYNQMRGQILDVLIKQELLWQDAKAKGILPKDEEVKQYIDGVKGKFEKPEEYDTQLKAAGFTEESFKDDAVRRLAVAKLVSDDIAKTVTVSDADIEKFYQDNPKSFTAPEQVRARHILIQVPADADEVKKKAAREKVDGLLEQVKKGGDFAELAKANSEDAGSAPNGGDLGFFGRGQMVKPFEDAAFGLKPGEVSGVIESQFGFHIIKVDEKQDSRVVPLAEVKDRVKEYLQSQKLQQAIEARAKALREGAKVEVTAK